MKVKATALAVILAASAAVAHQGVKNPAVMARMESMSAIAESTKILGTMSKGAVEFDAQAARDAAAEIAKRAEQTPVLFEANETDPKSEAKSVIWNHFDDFTQKSDDLVRVASDLSNTIQSADDLRAAVSSLGATCKACHATYRK